MLDDFIKDIIVDGESILNTPEYARKPLSEEEVNNFDKFENDDLSFEEAINTHMQDITSARKTNAETDL